MRTRKETIIDCFEFDKLVEEVYGRPYCFQQQDGCKSRGIERFSVPHDYPEEGETSLKEWLETEAPKEGDSSEELYWHRYFYPHFSEIVDDLHKKGKLKKGDYTMEIDW